MTTNFTPGPWKKEFNGYYWEVVPVNNQGEKGIPFAVCEACPSDPTNTRGIQEANAALIAAAPEMYEMLVYYVGQYGCKCGHPACFKCKDTIEAESILKKARGEK